MYRADTLININNFLIWFVIYSLQHFVLQDKTGSQTIDFLTKRILALGAIQSGHFLVDCETYIPSTANAAQMGK